MNESSESSLPEFQYELVRVNASEALGKYLALRTEGQGVFSPVILNSPEDYFQDDDGMAALRQDLPNILAAAGAISAKDFFERRKAEMGETYQELEKGSWPASPCKLEPILSDDTEEIFIVKVPTPNACEAVAYIGFGGWNDCPTDEEHVAVLRHWQERYGATLFAQSRDMLQCIVERPPATREEALTLAREQIVYALGTLGEFGCDQTVQNLAAALLNSRHWVFWWD